MTDQTMKKLLAFAAKNRETLSRLLSCFQPSDLENGLLRIPEKLLNSDFNQLILKRFSPYLTSCQVTFQNGVIFLELTGNSSQLGAVKALYQLQISDLIYKPVAHRVTFTYREDVQSEGGFLQGMLMRAAGMTKATYLKLAASLLKLPGVETGQTPDGQETCTVNLEAFFPFAQSPLNRFCLEFQDVRDGELLLKFTYTD